MKEDGVEEDVRSSFNESDTVSDPSCAEANGDSIRYLDDGKLSYISDSARNKLKRCLGCIFING